MGLCLTPVSRRVRVQLGFPLVEYFSRRYCPLWLIWLGSAYARITMAAAVPSWCYSSHIYTHLLIFSTVKIKQTG